MYPGIDVVYYHDKSKQLKYDFVVKPSADPHRIELAFEGADQINRNAAGDIVLTAGSQTIIQRRPRVYQEIGGRRVEIAARYRIEGERVQFALGPRDPRAATIIDPVIEYSTYLGGNTYDAASDIAVDAQGSAYITGYLGSGSI